MKKLVRDRIPEIIKSKGELPSFYIAKDEEFFKALNDKLFEECGELVGSKSNLEVVEEIADVLEVIDEIMAQKGIKHGDVLKIKEDKKIKKGGFTKKYILNMVDFYKK